MRSAQRALHRPRAARARGDAHAFAGLDLGPLLEETGTIVAQGQRFSGEQRTADAVRVGGEPFVVTVSEVALTFTVAGTKLDAWAFNMVSGAPVQGVSVEVTVANTANFNAPVRSTRPLWHRCKLPCVHATHVARCS